ncbi:MAG: hypothetical protein FWC33_02845 [Candidatus Bathyarchaeota archaeon]|nr:hypothetical protein [Candidatus Termiticorpusculum sp.]
MENQKNNKKWQATTIGLNKKIATMVQELIEQKSKEQDKVLLPYKFRSVSAFVTEATRLHLIEITKNPPAED